MSLICTDAVAALDVGVDVLAGETLAVL